MAKYPGLVQRGLRATYWFRRRIPIELVTRLGLGREINKSLRTRDFNEAVTRWAVEDKKARELFASRTETAPSPHTLSLKQACDILYQHRLKVEREYRQRIAESAVKDPAVFWAGKLIELPQTPEATRYLSKHPGNLWYMLALAFRESTQVLLDEAKVCAVTFNIDRYENFARAWNRDNSQQMVVDVYLAAALARTEIRVYRDILDDDAALLPTPPNSEAESKVSDGVPLLSTFCTDYIARRGQGLSEERADIIRATVRDLLEIVGDKPVTAYHVAEASAFEATMLALPANWTKKKQLRGLQIAMAAEKAKGLGLPRQAATNIRKKWSVLGSLFENAAITHPVKNPFIARALLVDDKVPANRRKDLFTPEELNVLLASKLPGHLNWLVWIGVYTGARLNELCQLTTAHVRKHGTIPYIYFSPELRLKTGEGESCVRAVPLHSGLVRRGVLDYAAKCAGRLFPGLVQHKSGRYSDAPSKAFTRHLREIGIKREKLSFNSLRHTFVGRLKTLAPADVETRERLVGHATKGVAGIYGGSYEAEACDMELLAHRAKVVARLQF